jgi:hypothetical protein
MTWAVHGANLTIQDPEGQPSGSSPCGDLDDHVVTE